MKISRLGDLDEKCIRVHTVWGEVFEGECAGCYNAECGEVIYGRAEAYLKLANFLFYESDIKSVEVLSGPEEFSGPFGTLELENIKDDVISVDGELNCEYEENSRRMLRCIEHYLDPANGLSLPFDVKELLAPLKELEALAEEEDVRRDAKALIERIGQGES